MSTKPNSPTIEGNRVLVTGGAGFIGSHIADALVPENDVRILDDFSTGSLSNVPGEATVLAGDVRDEDDLEKATAGADVIFHHAGLVSVEESIERPQPTHETNAGATVKLLERARDEGAKVVFASSAAVYGRPETVPIAEDDPVSPESPYGLSKSTAERYVRLYADVYDLPTVALRYFNVYGPRQAAGDYSGVISVFVDQASRGAPITVEGSGTQTGDFVHVRDVVQASLRAAAKDLSGEAFNVGTGDGTTVLELARAVRDAAGSESEIVHGPERPGDIAGSVADISKARAALEYEPTVPLEDGLETVIAGNDGTGTDLRTANELRFDGGVDVE